MAHAFNNPTSSSMKTTLSTAVVVLLTAVSTFGQGKIGYQNTSGLGKEKFIYGLDPNDPLSSLLGGPREKCAGTGYSAELWWGLSGNDLKPVDGSLTTFKSGTTAGLINGNSNLILQGVLGGTKIVLQVRAWENRGGAVKTWADVLIDGGVARGQSQLVTNYELSGVDADNGPHVGSGNIANAGFSSFGLYLVPEPSVVALAALGLGALILRRRK